MTFTQLHKRIHEGSFVCIIVRYGSFISSEIRKGWTGEMGQMSQFEYFLSHFRLVWEIRGAKVSENFFSVSFKRESFKKKFLKGNYEIREEPLFFNLNFWS